MLGSDLTINMLQYDDDDIDDDDDDGDVDAALSCENGPPVSEEAGHSSVRSSNQVAGHHRAPHT